MNKTHTPELSPEVLGRLRAYAELFHDDRRHEAQRPWSGVSLRGPLQDGDRKSIEPMVGRVPLPAELLAIRDPGRPSSHSSLRAPGTNGGSSLAFAR